MEPMSSGDRMSKGRNRKGWTHPAMTGYSGHAGADVRCVLPGRGLSAEVGGAAIQSATVARSAAQHPCLVPDGRHLSVLICNHVPVSSDI
ncbi:hypothetical protein AM571_PC01146 (plasmid) [Rhizobium etli 8C-3]|uniref:Uncharacterized protein n=1 Tax=Rhizobium etli 8C-3 TaxID=538025 RepID=A0A1L5PF39_RHIET|nr:hypothetical protein AM571_PC01146 [Rhizobium etli 8C-3]